MVGPRIPNWPISFRISGSKSENVVQIMLNTKNQEIGNLLTFMSVGHKYPWHKHLLAVVIYLIPGVIRVSSV